MRFITIAFVFNRCQEVSWVLKEAARPHLIVREMRKNRNGSLRVSPRCQSGDQLGTPPRSKWVAIQSKFFGGAGPAQPSLNNWPKFKWPSFGLLFQGMRVELSSLPGLARLFRFVLYQLEQAKFLRHMKRLAQRWLPRHRFSVGWRSLAPKEIDSKCFSGLWGMTVESLLRLRIDAAKRSLPARMPGLLTQQARGL